MLRRKKEGSLPVDVRVLTRKFCCIVTYQFTCCTLLGVSMDIYEGHVTALLGHNGAGKTTLIAMMTGMVPASEGNATIYGMDITDPIQMQEIRKLIGKLTILTS